MAYLLSRTKAQEREAFLIKENPLELLMEPRSIATVGAGNNPMKMGTIQALSIVKDGYPGKFYPLHPRDKKVFGYPAYPSPFDLPEAPDVVMFVLPAPLVAPLLDEFGQIGTRRAIIITAGFRETGEEGLRLEEELQETARRHGIRFLGPNCMGLINSALPLNVTVNPFNGPPGPLGLASQSGTYVTQTLSYLEQRGIRFSKAVSVGNSTDIDIIDALEYLGADEQTRAVALYIEGLKDGPRFLEVARRITPHKPVVAQYVGGSPAGARAGAGHTGSLAGPDYLYNGLFARAGIIRVDSVEELYNQAWTLATQPPLQGRRVAVITNSGGPGTAISHTLSSAGLEVPAFSPGLQEKIRPHLPPFGAAANPVDLTFHLDTEILSQTIPGIVLESGEVDGLIMHGVMGSGFLKSIYPHLADFVGTGVEEFVSSLSANMTRPPDLPALYGRPVVLSSFFGSEDNYTAAYRDLQIPVFDAPEKAARGMAALNNYRLARERLALRGPVAALPSSPPAGAILAGEVAARRRIIDEYTAKRLLATYGIPVSEDRLVNSPAEALQQAEELGYPLALKACLPGLVHKTEQGLLRLNLHSPEALQAAYSELSRAAGDAQAPMLLSRMVKGQREVMAGLVRHPFLGPFVLFGTGGIFAEVMAERAFRPAPLEGGEAAELLAATRVTALLEAVRGMPPADRQVLGAILEALGSLALHHPEIVEIDLNPIIIGAAGPVAVDALVVLAEETEARPRTY